jgi:C4-dicarboxylate-specific signal transduction histidine kinase
MGRAVKISSLIDDKLNSINFWHLIWMSVVCSEFFTAIMSFILKGKITYDYLITGSVVSLIVAGLVILLIQHTRKIEKQAKSALKKANNELENRVRQRTADLSASNVELNREMEARKIAQAQLIQSSKLASIGELAAGVAHELNQPLMVIRITAQFIERAAKNESLDCDTLMDHMKTVGRNTKRMMRTIGHLRVFSRQSLKVFATIDVNRVIEDCFLMVGEQLRIHNVEVRKTLEPLLPRILGDANQLEQVFLNLIGNARDALDQREQDEVAKAKGTPGNIKKIEILTRVMDNDKDNLEILIKDTGDGIEEENMGKIFDPFFTTKEIGKGTGLGLSISYGIIKDHEGSIEVAETGAEGTTFRIRLPVSRTDQ